MGEGTCRVRASTVRVRDQFVLARFGRLSRERYRATASPELLHLLSHPGDGWVDFGLFVEATELACRLFDDGSPTLAREIGAYGAEANMGPWRSLVHRLLSPATLLELAGSMWSHHYEGGVLTPLRIGDRGIAVRLSGFPRPHPMHCASVEGWCERMLRFGKPRALTIRKTACRLRGDDFCELVGEWE